MVVFQSIPERGEAHPGTQGQLKSEAEVVVASAYYGFVQLFEFCGRQRLESAVGRDGNSGMDVFLDRRSGLRLYRLLGLAELVI